LARPGLARLTGATAGSNDAQQASLWLVISVPAEQPKKKGTEDDGLVRVVSTVKAAQATMRSRPAFGSLSVCLQSS
jgi:hypothetical protein